MLSLSHTGKVLVNDQPVLKSGAQVKDGASIQLIAAAPKYVCRAGLKLEAALKVRLEIMWKCLKHVCRMRLKLDAALKGVF